MVREFLVAGLLAYSFLSSSGVMAQDASANTDKTAAETGPTPEMGDIVVTATRRAESMQKVPVAVTALGELQLERLQISNLADAGAGTPNTTVFRNPSSSSSSLIYIRGIGDDSSNILREFPVSQYIDGVYVGRNLGGLLDLIGFERIEVLRGPQGTLYGRNSTGGAVKLVTKRPEFDDVYAKGDVTVGSFQRQDFRVMANVPLSDTLAANISGGSSNNDGYYTDINTGGKLNAQSIRSLRGGLLWKPTERLSLYLTGDYTHDNSGLQVPTQMSASSGAGMDIPLYGGFYKAAPNQPNLNKVNVWGTGLQVDYALDFGNLQSVTAYRGVDFRANYDYGGAPIGADLIRDTSQKQFSQELQFASTFDGPFQIIGGLYYYHETGKGYEGFIFVSGGTPTPYAFRQTSNSWTPRKTLAFDGWI